MHPGELPPISNSISFLPLHLTPILVGMEQGAREVDLQ